MCVPVLAFTICLSKFSYISRKNKIPFVNVMKKGWMAQLAIDALVFVYVFSDV